MLEWIISSSVLIAVIILLRSVLKGKISLRLQYALWALVLVRLLLPFSFGSSTLSIMNQVERSDVYQEVIAPEGHTPGITLPQQSAVGNIVPTVPNNNPAPPVTLPDSGTDTGNSETEQSAPNTNEAPKETPPAQSDSNLDVPRILHALWLGGSIVLGVWFLAANLLFAAKLRQNRTAMDTAFQLPVYLCDAVDTPCLFGLFRPAVYLTDEVAANERTMRHALER